MGRWKDAPRQRDESFRMGPDLGHDACPYLAVFRSAMGSRQFFFKSFSPDDEEALRILAQFAESIVTRHVFDAKDIPDNALPVLDDCVQRVIDDRAFAPNGYCAGEIHGYDMPNL